VNTSVGSVVNITDIIPTANYTLCLRARNCGGLGPENCIILIAPEAGECLKNFMYAFIIGVLLLLQ